MEAILKCFPKSKGYENLPQNEKAEPTCPFSFCNYHKQKIERQNGRQCWRNVFVSLLILLLSISLAGTTTYLFSQHRRYSQVVAASEVDCNCGNSIAEAISKGCRYDAVSTSWLPAACRDDELIDEFNRIGPGPNGTWTYYSSKSGDGPMTVEQVALLAESPVPEARRFWATHEWHVQHCLFYWRKEFRVAKSARLRLEAMKHGSGIKRKSKSENGGTRRGGDLLVMEHAYTFEFHIVHCAKLMLHPKPKDEITISAMAGLTSDYVESGRELEDDDDM